MNIDYMHRIHSFLAIGFKNSINKIYFWHARIGLVCHIVSEIPLNVSISAQSKNGQRVNRAQYLHDADLRYEYW